MSKSPNKISEMLEVADDMVLAVIKNQGKKAIKGKKEAEKGKGKKEEMKTLAMEENPVKRLRGYLKGELYILWIFLVIKEIEVLIMSNWCDTFCDNMNKFVIM